MFLSASDKRLRLAGNKGNENMTAPMTQHPSHSVSALNESLNIYFIMQHQLKTVKYPILSKLNIF